MECEGSDPERDELATPELEESDPARVDLAPPELLADIIWALAPLSPQLVLNRKAEKARAAGIEVVQGRYLASEKMKLVYRCGKGHLYEGGEVCPVCSRARRIAWVLEDRARTAQPGRPSIARTVALAAPDLGYECVQGVQRGTRLQFAYRCRAGHYFFSKESEPRKGMDAGDNLQRALTGWLLKGACEVCQGKAEVYYPSPGV
jgi:hypothetical protein